MFISGNNWFYSSSLFLLFTGFNQNIIRKYSSRNRIISEATTFLSSSNQDTGQCSRVEQEIRRMVAQYSIRKPTYSSTYIVKLFTHIYIIYIYRLSQIIRSVHAIFGNTQKMYKELNIWKIVYAFYKNVHAKNTRFFEFYVGISELYLRGRKSNMIWDSLYVSYSWPNSSWTKLA